MACNNIHQAEHSETATQKELALYDNMPADGVLGQLGFTGTSSPILDAQSLDSPHCPDSHWGPFICCRPGQQSGSPVTPWIPKATRPIPQSVLLQDNANHP